MSFGNAIRSCFNQYAGFSGRARRSEYWWFVLFTFLVEFAAAIVAVALQNVIIGILALLVPLALFLPSLAVTVRRLHDTGRSGWWWFIGAVPLVGGIVLLVFQCTDSEPGPNRFGPSPKYGQGNGAEQRVVGAGEHGTSVLRQDNASIAPVAKFHLEAGETHDQAISRLLRTYWARYQVGEPFGPGLGFEGAVEKVSRVLADEPAQLPRLSDQHLTTLMTRVHDGVISYDDWDAVLGLRWSSYRDQYINRAGFQAVSRSLTTIKELGSQQAQGRGDLLDRWRIDATFQREVLVWSVVIDCRLREAGKLTSTRAADVRVGALGA